MASDSHDILDEIFALVSDESVAAPASGTGADPVAEPDSLAILEELTSLHDAATDSEHLSPPSTTQPDVDDAAPIEVRARLPAGIECAPRQGTDDEGVSPAVAGGQEAPMEDDVGATAQDSDTHVFMRVWPARSLAQLHSSLATLASSTTDLGSDIDAAATLVRLCLHTGTVPARVRSQVWCVLLGVSLHQETYEACPAYAVPPSAQHESLRKDCVQSHRAAVEAAGADKVVSLEDAVRVVAWAVAEHGGGQYHPVFARLMTPLLAAQPTMPVGLLTRAYLVMLCRLAPSLVRERSDDFASSSAGEVDDPVSALSSQLHRLVLYHSPSLVAALDAAAPGWCAPRSSASSSLGGPGCLPASWLTSWFAGAGPVAWTQPLWDRLLLATQAHQLRAATRDEDEEAVTTSDGGRHTPSQWDLHACGPTRAASLSALLLSAHLLLHEGPSLALICSNNAASSHAQGGGSHASYLIHLTLEGALRRTLQRFIIGGDGRGSPAPLVENGEATGAACATGTWMEEARSLGRATPPSFIAYLATHSHAATGSGGDTLVLSPSCSTVIRVPARPVAVQLVYGWSAVAEAAAMANCAADREALPHPSTSALLLPLAGLHAAGDASLASCGPAYTGYDSGVGRQLRQCLLQLHGTARYLVVDIRPIRHRLECGRVAKAIHIDPRTVPLPSLSDGVADASGVDGSLASLPPEESLPSAASLVGLPLSQAVQAICSLVLAHEEAQVAVASESRDEPLQHFQNAATAPLQVAILGMGVRHQSIVFPGARHAAEASMSHEQPSSHGLNENVSGTDKERVASASLSQPSSFAPTSEASVQGSESPDSANFGIASVEDDKSDASSVHASVSAPVSSAPSLTVNASDNEFSEENQWACLDDALVNGVVAALLQGLEGRFIPRVCVVDGGYVALHHTLVRPAVGLVRPLAPPAEAVAAILSSHGHASPPCRGHLTVDDALALHGAVLVGVDHGHDAECPCCVSLMHTHDDCNFTRDSYFSLVEGGRQATLDYDAGGSEGPMFPWAPLFDGQLGQSSAAVTLELVRERFVTTLAPRAVAAAVLAREAASAAVETFRGFMVVRAATSGADEASGARDASEKGQGGDAAGGGSVFTGSTTPGIPIPAVESVTAAAAAAMGARVDDFLQRAKSLTAATAAAAQSLIAAPASSTAVSVGEKMPLESGFEQGIGGDDLSGGAVAGAAVAAESASPSQASVLASKAREEASRLASKLLQVGKAALAPPPSSYVASAPATISSKQQQSSGSPSGAALTQAASSASHFAGAAFSSLANRAKEKVKALQEKAAEAAAGGQGGGFTVGAALKATATAKRGTSSAVAVPPPAAAPAPSPAFPSLPTCDPSELHRLAGLNRGQKLHREALGGSCMFFPVLKEKEIDGEQALLPRLLAVTPQRVFVLETTTLDDAVAITPPPFVVKSNHHVTELAKLGYSKKKCSVTLYYRRSMPAPSDTPTAADGSSSSPAQSSAPGDAKFVIALVPRVYRVESEAAAEHLKAHLQAAITKLMF